MSETYPAARERLLEQIAALGTAAPEKIEVAVFMGGGPSVVYGAQAHRALTEFLGAAAGAPA